MGIFRNIIKANLQVFSKPLSVQNPIPSDSDSVYEKDLDIANCDNGDFQAVSETGALGVVSDYFNSLKTINSNTTSDNPKTIKLWFKRSVYAHAIGFGCDDLLTGFGDSITIELLGSGEAVRATYNFSPTNPNSFLAEFGPAAFNGVNIHFNTASTVCLSNITIQKSNETNATIHGQSSINGTIEDIRTYKNTLQVDTALVHEVAVNRHVWRESGVSTTLTADVSPGDTSFTVASATGVSVGDDLILKNTNHQSNHHLDVVNVVSNTITVNRPIDRAYSIGDSVIEIDYGMNVNASLASPASYKIQPLPNQRYQITTLLMTILSSTDMDDGRFGGITALTNGVTLRTHVDGVFRTFTHWQDNADMKDDMYFVNYSAKAPAGQYGLSALWELTRAQFVVDLEGSNGDYLEILIQDDLSALVDFNIKAQGRLFGG